MNHIRFSGQLFWSAFLVSILLTWITDAVGHAGILVQLLNHDHSRRRLPFQSIGPVSLPKTSVYENAPEECSRDACRPLQSVVALHRSED